MKNQALFSLKDKSKKIQMSSAVIFVWRFKGRLALVGYIKLFIVCIFFYHS